MNKIKEELILVMDGHDVDDAYDVVKKYVLSFSTFFAENCFELFDSKTYFIRDHETLGATYTIEDLYFLWENELL